MKRSYILRSLEEKDLLLESGQLLILNGFSPYSVGIIKEEIPHLETKTLRNAYSETDKTAFVIYEELKELEKDQLLSKSVSKDMQILLVNNIISYDKIILCSNIVSANFVFQEDEDLDEDKLIETEVFNILSGLINTKSVSKFSQINIVDPLSIPYQNFSDCDPNLNSRSENKYEVKLPSEGMLEEVFSSTKKEAKEEFCKKNNLSRDVYFNKLLVSLKSTNGSRTLEMIMNKILFLLRLKTLLEHNKTHDLENKKKVLSTKLNKELEALKTEKNLLLKNFPTSDTIKHNRLKFINLSIEIIENKYSKEFKKLLVSDDDEIHLISEGLEYLFLVAREKLPYSKLTLRDFHPYNLNNPILYIYREDIYRGLIKASEQIHDSLYDS
jgi:hypothetical protein